MAASLLSRYRLMGVPSPAEPFNRSLATSIMRILYQHAGQDRRLATEEAAQPDPNIDKVARLRDDFVATRAEIERLHNQQQFPRVPGDIHKLSAHAKHLQNEVLGLPSQQPPVKGYTRKYPKGQAPRGRRKGSKPKKTEVERLREIAGTASAGGRRRGRPPARPSAPKRAKAAAAEAVLDLSEPVLAPAMRAAIIEEMEGDPLLAQVARFPLAQRAAMLEVLQARRSRAGGNYTDLSRLAGPEGASGIAAPSINISGQRHGRDIPLMPWNPEERPARRRRMASDEAMMDEAGDLMAANIERQRVQASLEEDRNNLPNVIPAVYNAANNIQVPPAPILMAEAAASAAQESEPDVQPM